MDARTYRLSELAELTAAAVTGGGDPTISGAASLEDAGPGQICFMADRRQAPKLAGIRAGAVILPPEVAYTGPALRADDPKAVYARILELFETPREDIFPEGIHPTAIVDPGAALGEGTRVGPHAVVGAGARLGARVYLGPGVVVEPGAEIGEGSRLYARVVVRERCRIGRDCILHPGAVIGSDGFGYHSGADGLQRVPQIGIAVLEDRVEIGANTCVDRATTGETRIGLGTKIDNLVQVGHNVRVGRHCAISAQSGISGSCRLGDGVVLGGQVGIADHLTVGDGVKVAAKSGLTRDVPDGLAVFGYPAVEFRKGFRLVALTHRLPDLFRRVEFLEKAAEDRPETEESGAC